jgi:hypothetical protein
VWNPVTSYSDCNIQYTIQADSTNYKDASELTRHANAAVYHIFHYMKAYVVMVTAFLLPIARAFANKQGL